MFQHLKCCFPPLSLRSPLPKSPEMTLESSHITAHDKEVLNRLFNPNLPYGDVVDDDDDVRPLNEEVETEEVKQVKHLENDGVRAAETGDIQKALDLFSQAISLLPTRASGYNNRAQTLRLKGDVQGALDDLNKAVELSEGHGQAACQAFTQRALIYKLEGKEEESLEDFKSAAKLGGQFAKQQVIAMNPYAALCNQMLSEVIHKVKAGEM